jgi:metallo-beta-lactamase class B
LKNKGRLFLTAIIALPLFSGLAFSGSKVIINADLEVQELAPRIWMHTSFMDIPGFGRSGANGLIVIGDKKIIIIDTPWTNTQAKQLDAWLLKMFNRESNLIIPTHFHSDNLGGLPYYHGAGRDSLALDKTVALCRKLLPITPKREFKSSLMIEEAPFSLELFYPGEGHSPDNIVVMIRNTGILFGGCLVKALANKNIGNTDDANPGAWEATLLNVKKRFPDAKIVVPGHGQPGDLSLIDHTIGIVEKYLQER